LEKTPEAFDESLEGVERVRQIVQAMRDFPHPGTGHKERVDLNRIIESTTTVTRNEWKYVAELSMDLDPSLPLVSCLPSEFSRVLVNLIINAAHAISDVVGDGEKEQGTILVRSRLDGKKVEVSIQDTGSGIPADVQPRIFDPFFTTKEVGKGTGQGLAISHTIIVDQHEGELLFETTAGQGTTFIIRIPIDQDEPSG
jgi:signal transduction histidine kinase